MGVQVWCNWHQRYVDRHGLCRCEQIELIKEHEELKDHVQNLETLIVLLTKEKGVLQ